MICCAVFERKNNHYVNVTQDCIAAEGRGEIKELKDEYVDSELMVNMCRDRDAIMLRIIRSGLKAFTTIKDLLETKHERALICLRCYIHKRNVEDRGKERTETVY